MTKGLPRAELLAADGITEHGSIRMLVSRWPKLAVPSAVVARILLVSYSGELSYARQLTLELFIPDGKHAAKRASEQKHATKHVSDRSAGAFLVLSPFTTSKRKRGGVRTTEERD